MYTNILKRADGSGIPGEAVQYSIVSAKWIRARATVLEVVWPFHRSRQTRKITAFAFATSLQ